MITIIYLGIALLVDQINAAMILIPLLLRIFLIK